MTRWTRCAVRRAGGPYWGPRYEVLAWQYGPIRREVAGIVIPVLGSLHFRTASRVRALAYVRRANVLGYRGLAPYDPVVAYDLHDYCLLR